MCTSIVEVVGAEGAGKGAGGWFELDRAVVSYDHPHHALLEDAITVDFVNSALGPGARVAVGALSRACPRDRRRRDRGERPRARRRRQASVSAATILSSGGGASIWNLNPLFSSELPALAARQFSRLGTVDDIVALIAENEPESKKRGPYRSANLEKVRNDLEYQGSTQAPLSLEAD